MFGSEQVEQLLTLEPLDADRFIGDQPAASTLDKVYGGQLFGQSLAAAQMTVDPARHAHSLQAFCVEAGAHGRPVQYQVERLRDGRSFSARSVTATQDGRFLMRAAVSFHVAEPGLTHVIRLPDVPPPEELPTLQDAIRDYSSLADDSWRREWAGLDLRYNPQHLLTRERPRPGVQQVWMRVRAALPDDPALHRRVLTYLSDLTLLNTSLVPHGILIGAPELPRATLNHTVWLHTDLRTDDWLLFDQRSSWAGAARGHSSAHVFTREGQHVASLAQEGLIRPLGELRHQLGVE